MATQVQRRRGTTTEHSTFTGAEGELTVDTTKDTVVVHDGATAGGQPLAREDLDNVSSADVTAKVSAGTTSAAGKVQLEDSTTSTSTTTAATPNSVKVAKDAADAAQSTADNALASSGGTITGPLTIGTDGSLTFEGATTDDFETTLAITDPTADRTITLPDIDGTLVTTGDTGTVTSTMIADGTIVDGDISASAEIAVSKLANGTARQILQTDAAGTGVEFASNIDVPGTLDVTGNATFDANVTVQGDLTVNGTTTTIDTETLLVKDKNIEMGVVGTPTDTTADGGGITLKGTTDKTINWIDSTDSWTSSENVDLASGKTYKIAGTDVLSATTLGSAVVNSSLTSVGNLTDLTVLGTSGTYPTTEIKHSELEIEGEILRIGRTDATTRYHSITAQQSATTGGATNYLAFKLHDVTGQTAQTEVMRLTGAGNVGIGAPSPDAKLHALIGTSGKSWTPPTGTSALFERNSINYVTIAAANNNTSQLNFADTDDADIGNIKYSHANNSLTFGVNNSDRLVIDSSGRLLVGASSFTGPGLFAVRGNSSTATGAGVAYLVRGESSADMADSDILGVLRFGDQDDNRSAEIRSGIDGTPSSTASPGDLSFWTTAASSVAPTQRMTIDSSGRVGVGMTPSADASITDVPAGLIQTDGNIDIRYPGSNTDPAGARYLSFINTDTTLVAGQPMGGMRWVGNDSDNPSSDTASILAYCDGNAGTVSHITFNNGGTESARIDSSGRLLVGTASTSVGSTAVFQGNSSGSSFGAILNLAVGTATPGDGNELGILSFSDNGHDRAAEIFAARDGGTWTSNSSQPTRLVFRTTADGASSPTERMSISQEGYIFPDFTSRDNKANIKGTVGGFKVVSSSSASTTRLECFALSTDTRYGIAFSNPNGIVGSISTNASATAFNTSSDYRLKENVVPLTGAADRLNQLQVHRFNFIADPDTTVDGFIAHEAQTVVPECVTGEKDAVDEDGNPVYQGIDQSKLVPLLTAALQEALAKIETLEQRLNDAGIT